MQNMLVRNAAITAVVGATGITVARLQAAQAMVGQDITTGLMAWVWLAAFVVALIAVVNASGRPARVIAGAAFVIVLGCNWTTDLAVLTNGADAIPGSGSLTFGGITAAGMLMLIAAVITERQPTGETATAG